MESKISKIIYGIRHKRLYKFLSVAGDIVDELMQLQGSGDFPEECFKMIAWAPDKTGFKLFDEEETFEITCDVDGVVFNCDMDAEPILSLDRTKNIFKTISEKTLSISGGVNQLTRVGIVKIYKFSTDKNAAKIISDSIMDTNLTGIFDDFRMRFAVKYPIEAGSVKTVINDYKNVIFQILSKRESDDKESPPDIIQLGIDYQRYFEPAREYSNLLIDEHYKDFDEYEENLNQTNIGKLISNQSHVQKTD